MFFFIRVIIADCQKKCKSCCAKKKAKGNSTRPLNYKEDEGAKGKATESKAIHKLPLLSLEEFKEE